MDQVLLLLHVDRFVIFTAEKMMLFFGITLATYLFTWKRRHAVNRLTSLLHGVITGDGVPRDCVTFNSHLNVIRTSVKNWNDTVCAAAHSSSAVKDVVTAYFTNCNESEAFATGHVICLCAFLCDACVLMIKNGVPLDVCDAVQHLVRHMIDRDVTVCVKYLNMLKNHK